MNSENGVGGGQYVMTCFGADGTRKWEEVFDNTVMSAGLQDMNAKYFAGSGYTAAWYLGLITGPTGSATIVTGDTLASHAGWTESTDYAGTRKTCTFGTATTANPSVTTNSAAPASFVMNASLTVTGAFLASVTSGTSGILFSAAKFTSPGDRVVISGDTLIVTYTYTYTGT